jgi:hypothetical protein
MGVGGYIYIIYIFPDPHPGPCSISRRDDGYQTDGLLLCGRIVEQRVHLPAPRHDNIHCLHRNRRAGCVDLSDNFPLQKESRKSLVLVDGCVEEYIVPVNASISLS